MKCLEIEVKPTGIDPDEIARSLKKPINGNVFFVKILERRPPTTVKVIDVVALAEGTNYPPVGIRNREPFAITGTDVNVYGAKIVVLLMARCTTPRYLNVVNER